MRTLVVAPSWIGDAVLSQPLIVRLKEARPGGSDRRAGAPLGVAGVPAHAAGRGATIALPFGHGELALGGRRRFAKTLPRYDRAVVLPNS